MLYINYCQIVYYVVYYLLLDVSQSTIQSNITRMNVIKTQQWVPYFDVLLTVHLGIILVIDQLNAQILVL